MFPLALLLCLSACGDPPNEVFVSLSGNALAVCTWVCTIEVLDCVELLKDEYISGDTFCTFGKSGTYAFTYGPVQPGQNNRISLEILEAPDYTEGMY